MLRARTLVAGLAAAALGAAVVVPAAAGASQRELTALVNPLAGSLGPGFVTVAAGLPFGMVTPGPITTTPAGDDQVNYVGYGYQDPEIRGFALTHFSGAGIHIGGELPIMPTTGAVTSSNPTDWASPYSHADETAQPGYYATTLDRYQVRAELTATTRVAVERFTFPATQQANLLLDVSRDNDTVQQGELHILDNRTVTGSVTVPGSGGVTIWFTARFDRPFTAHGTWLGSTLTPGGNDASGSGAGGWVTFDTTNETTVGARVAISYVDPAGATTNLSTEAPDGTSFDAVRARADKTWNTRLHCIQVTGGSQGRQATFYTNLYHALLMPTTYDDADGRYRGFDDVIRTVPRGHHHYTDLSLWDTYRTQTPLLALAVPDVARDVGVSLLDDTDQNHGVIPKWVRGNRDYSIMGGDSGTATLAALVGDGILTGDAAQRAFVDVVRQATTLPPVDPRGGLDDYLQKGYIPNDVSDRGASVTLEFAIDDAAVAAIARQLSDSEQAAVFAKRAESWRNLLDPSDHFLRPRNSDGSWASPTSVGVTSVWNPAFSDGWQEGTGWQYLWLVPQDVAGLEKALGPMLMRHRLAEFFATPAQRPAAPVVPIGQEQASFFGVYYAGNQFTPANETDLQAPWLYNWLGAPAKTQRIVHAESRVYSTLPYGLPGNDDAGTMSAGYVLSAIGLYQAQPGVAAWELSSPLFTAVKFGSFTITADGASGRTPYIGAAHLAGKSFDRTWLSTKELQTAHRLELAMVAKPTAWGTQPQDAPPSLSQ